MYRILMNVDMPVEIHLPDIVESTIIPVSDRRKLIPEKSEKIKVKKNGRCTR